MLYKIVGIVCWGLFVGGVKERDFFLVILIEKYVVLGLIIEL